jgi:hypothetical protein
LCENNHEEWGEHVRRAINENEHIPQRLSAFEFFLLQIDLLYREVEGEREEIKHKSR